MTLGESDERVAVRNTRPDDFGQIEHLSRIVYPSDFPWTEEYLRSHLDVFPEGHLVAVDTSNGEVVGCNISFIISWDDYDHLDDYHQMTDEGYLTNHDPRGRTLYGAEVMVHPERRGMGIGSKLYEARFDLARRLKMLRIRAGARLPGYHRYEAELDIETYVREVVKGVRFDPTLSFQLKHGFHVLTIIPDYFDRDPKSRDYAALIEWINIDVARPEDYAARPHRFDAEDS